MITGVVQADEGRIRLRIKGLRGREREIEAVIDTGYTASLTLPSALIVALGLRWRSVDRGMLADGSECLVDVYEAKVVWDSKLRQILVDEVGMVHMWPVLGNTLVPSGGVQFLPMSCRINGFRRQNAPEQVLPCCEPCHEVDAEPLVGMRLLRGHELKMQVRAGGKVTIKRLP
jgi:clan AA aspartic protease